MHRGLTYTQAVLLILGLFLLLFGYHSFFQQHVMSLYSGNENRETFQTALNHLFGTSMALGLLVLLVFSVLLFRFVQSHERERYSHEKIAALYKENRLYFENAAVGFLVVDAQRQILQVNPMLCEIFGYDEESLIGGSTEIFHIDAEHFHRWGKEVFDKAQKDVPVRERFEMKKKGGERIWIEVSGAPIRKYDGVLSGGVIWTIVDVTEEMRSKNMVNALNSDLQESITFLRGMINIAPIPIYLKDEHLRYRECNAAFLKLINKQKKDVIGMRADEIYSKAIGRVINQADDLLRHNPFQHYTEAFKHEGENYILEFHKVAITHEKRFKGLVGVIVDMTEQENQKADLDRRIREAVAQNIEQERRHLEERMADVKFAALGKLAAGITHEINTPLTFIKGNSEMLGYEIDDIENPQTKEAVAYCHRHILEGVVRIESIVASMREMSQQSGESMERMNIFDTLHTVLTMAHNRSKHIVAVNFQGNPFVLNMERPAGSCECVAQRQRLEQVWIIIINNALDQLEQHGSFENNHLDIFCECDAKEVKVRFKDNGGGIDANLLATLFEAFVSSKLHGGIGIGLNIAKKIVEDQKGSIRAYNEGDGAVFEVTLPAVQA